MTASFRGAGQELVVDVGDGLTASVKGFDDEAEKGTVSPSEMACCPWKDHTAVRSPATTRMGTLKPTELMMSSTRRRS